MIDDWKLKEAKTELDKLKKYLNRWKIKILSFSILHQSLNCLF